MEVALGREGTTSLGPLCAASAAITRVSDERPSGPRRCLSVGSGRSPPARPRKGDAQLMIRFVPSWNSA